MTTSPPNPHRAFPTPSDGSPLDWEAFRYIADEMDPEESARFEQRLQEDAAACAAVADAVALASQLRDAWEPTAQWNRDPQHAPISRTASQDRFRSFHFYRAAAVWLAILMGGWLLVQAVPPTRVARSESEPLASAWAELVAAGEFELEESAEMELPEWNWVDPDETDWMLVALQDLQAVEGDNE